MSNECTIYLKLKEKSDHSEGILGDFKIGTKKG